MAAGFGNALIGGDEFASDVVVAPVISTHVAEGRNRVETGFFQGGRRAYLRPHPFEPLVISEADPSQVQIEIQSVSGALVGKIRTDTQNTIVHEVTFTLDDNGCKDFSLKLLELPPFDILDFSIIIIRIGNTTFDWYKGIIDYPDSLGTDREFIEFRGNGLFTYLKTISGDDASFAAGQDIGEIVDFIASGQIADETPINYNPTKINMTTGVINANPIELTKHNLEKVLQTFADMTQHRFGVDGDGDFFFEPRETTIQKTFFVGYDVQTYKPKLNLQEVKNAITVLRQQGKSEGGAGWKVGGIFTDATSVALFKKRKLEYQVPGFMETSEVNLIGDSLLDEKKDPKVASSADGIELLDESDFMPRGFYRFVLPFGEFSEVFNDIDEESEWQAIGAGDITKADSTVFFVHGKSSLQVDYQDAQNDRVELTQNFKGNLLKIRFYIRSNRAGAYLTAGIGLTNFDEHTTKIDIVSQLLFQAIEWDVSALNLKEINKFAIRIDEPDPGAPNTFFIDRLEFVVEGHKTYRQEFKKAKYKISGRDQSISADFGVLPPNMEDYLAGLFANASELRFTQEIVT